MKRELEICGRRMVVYATKDAGSPSKDGPHTSYCIGRVDVHRDLAAFRGLCKTIRKRGGVDRVMELFGGSGWHAASIQELLSPDVHFALDISKDCIRSMEESDLQGVNIVRADSYKFAATTLRKHKFDWVHADFNQFTLNRANESKYKETLIGAFKSAERFVTITDSAIFGIVRFEKNRRSYAQSYGMDPDDWLDYYRVVSEHYRKHFDFGIVRVIHWSGMASMYLLEKGWKAELRIKKQVKPAKVIEL